MKLSTAVFVALISALLAVTLAQNESAKTADEVISTPWEDRQWNRFKTIYSKKYRTASREAKRKSIFLANLRSIQNFNTVTDDDADHFLKVNKFADWTKEELGMLTGEIDTDNVIPGNVMSDDLLRQAVPDSVELKYDRCMPPVKNQGPCGSCYSFAAITPIEYQRCKKSGNLTILSEENLLDCSQKYGNAGCNGGLALRAWNYIAANGINTNSYYPYQGEETSCEFKASNVAARVTSWAYATTSRDEEAMRVALAKFGPLSVSVDATEWAFYDKGVASFPNSSKTSTNHAVVIVGYGYDNVAKKPYWTIRNSWGADWGENGYIRLERGANTCGVAKRVVYPVAF